MSDVLANLYHAELRAIVEKMVADKLKLHRQSLAQTTGVLPPVQLPTPGGSSDPGGGSPGGIVLSDDDPADAGPPAAPGTSGYASRADHVHGVTAIQGYNVANIGPTEGQLLTWVDALSRWEPADPLNSGTVTSVDFIAPPIFTVAGVPITASGTITVGLATQSANLVWAGPSTGSPAAPTFRALVSDDIPNLASSKITTGEIPRSPLTTRGDLLTQNPNGTHVRLAIGTAARYLRSDGTDPSWHTLDFVDLTYSGLTAGQVLRATGASAAAFGAVDLADTDAITGILPAANGGTGINNSTRTLTINTNGGTLDFSSASLTLTIPATGTAALRASSATAGRVGFWSSAAEISHDSALFWDNSAKALLIGSVAGALTIGSSAIANAILSIRNNLSTTYAFTLETDNAGRGFRVITPDFVNTTTGSLLVMSMAAGSGNTDASIQAFSAGGSSVNAIRFQAGGGYVYIGKTSGLTGAGDIDAAGNIRTDKALLIKDAITAPSTTSGYATIYVDTADGDLKVKFGDGTVKTIVVDT